MHADSYDVVIVGAGVAGCAVALSLPPGTKALLVERARSDSERCCGGLLATDAQTALTVLGLKLPSDVRIQPEPQFVHALDLDSGREQRYRRNYVNLDRALFDAWLFGLAEQRVDTSPQTRFVSAAGDEILLRQGDETIPVRARIVIGADGANSSVRRHFFPERPRPTTMVAMQAKVAPGSATIRGRTPEHEVLFASALTDFYAWAVPKCDGMLVGSAFEQALGARKRFDRIVEWYQERLGLGAVLNRSSRRLSRPRGRADLCGGGGTVWLVGEAAGLVSPSSGEGISFALLSGKAAGEALGAAVPNDAYAHFFTGVSRRLLAKTMKAHVIYNPRLRSLAMRLPWYP